MKQAAGSPAMRDDADDGQAKTPLSSAAPRDGGAASSRAMRCFSFAALVATVSGLALLLLLASSGNGVTALSTAARGFPPPTTLGTQRRHLAVAAAAAADSPVGTAVASLQRRRAAEVTMAEVDADVGISLADDVFNVWGKATAGKVMVAAAFLPATSSSPILLPPRRAETDPTVSASLNAKYADWFFPHSGTCYTPPGPAGRAMLRRRRSNAPELEWQTAAREIGRSLHERQFGEHQRCDDPKLKMQSVMFNVWGFEGMVIDHMDEQLIGPWMMPAKLMLYADAAPYHSINSNGNTKEKGSASLTWAKGDSTLPCNTYYGCYWKPLSKCDWLRFKKPQIPAKSPLPQSRARPEPTTYDALAAQLQAFHYRYGPLLLRIAMQGYLWRPTDAFRIRIDAVVKPIFSASKIGDLQVDATGAGNCVAVHIRRGDECHDRNKVCPPISLFIDAAGLLAKRYGLTSLFLATDDEQAIKEVVTKLPHLTVVWNKAVDRRGYAVTKEQSAEAAAAASGKPKYFVEEKVARGELSPTPILDVLVDIEAASRCSAFVGDGQSHVSDAILLRMAWKLGAVPPFYSTRGNLGLPWMADGTSAEMSEFWTQKKHFNAAVPLEECDRPTTVSAAAAAPVVQDFRPAPNEMIEVANAPLLSKAAKHDINKWLREEMRVGDELLESEKRVIQISLGTPADSHFWDRGARIAKRFCTSLPSPSFFEKSRYFHPDASVPLDADELRRAAVRAEVLRTHIEAQSATCAPPLSRRGKRFATPQYGAGAKLTAMLKPWTTAFGSAAHHFLGWGGSLSHFATPSAPEGGDISRWGIMPLHPPGGKGCERDAVPSRVHAPSVMDEKTQEKDMVKLIPAEYRSEGLFWWVAQTWSWLLRPDPTLRAEIDILKTSLQWEHHRPILAIHLRGGDSCIDGQNTGNGGAWRKCSTLAEMLVEAKYLMELYTFGAIFLATDVDAVLAEARAITASNELGIPILTAPPRMSTAKLRGAVRSHKKVGVHKDGSRQNATTDLRFEDTIRMGLVNPTLDTREVIRDLHLLSEADAFVGKYSSNIDRIAIALSYGNKQCAVPFTSIDSPWCTNFGWGIGRNFQSGKNFLC